MSKKPAAGLLQFLQRIPDPRGRQGRRHQLVAMLATIVAATLCRCSGFDAIAGWIHALEPEVWHALGYLRKPPSANTFRNLLLVLDVQALETALARWVEGLGLDVSASRSVILDGKTLRGTKGVTARMLQFLTLADLATGGVLAEAQVPRETNESKAALTLLKDLVLQNKLVVADASFLQTDFCQQVLDSGGDYLVLVKDNQPTLHRACQQAFVIPKDFSPLRPTTGA